MADNYCNNCGKYGHVYHLCKLPIISIGVISFRIVDSKIQYLTIRRKDTFGFIDFMRGKYSVQNKHYILNMFKQMTVQEKAKLLYSQVVRERRSLPNCFNHLLISQVFYTFTKF